MVKITDKFDPWMLNSLLQNPDVYSSSAEKKILEWYPPSKIDFTPLIQDAKLRVFIGLDGVTPTGFVSFRRKGLIRWEIHTGWRRDYRGLWAKKGCELAIQEMFDWGAQTLTAEIAETNKPCIVLAGCVGFRRVGSFEGAWDNGDGTVSNMVLYEMTRKMWGR